MQVRGRRPEVEPGHERDHGDRQHHRHEHPGDPVGQPLDRRLGALGLLHQADDPGEHGIAPHALDPEPERAVPIECRADHRVAARLDNGMGSPVSIDSSTWLVPSRTMPSAGIVSPGRTTTSSPGRSCPERHLFLAAVAQHAGRCGTQTDEPADRAGGPSLGPGLEQIAEQDQRDDPVHRLVVDVRLDAVRGEPVIGQRDGGAEEEGGAGADRDQGVHVRAVVAEGGPRAGIECRPAQPTTGSVSASRM